MLFDTGLLAVCRILFCRVFNSHSQYPLIYESAVLDEAGRKQSILRFYAEKQSGCQCGSRDLRMFLVTDMVLYHHWRVP